MKDHGCCNHQCNQGRTCQARADRRIGPSLLWRLLGWLMVDRRSGIERRKN